MRFKIGIILIVLSFILFSKISSAYNSETYKEISTILNVADQNNIEIKTWNFYYRIMDENLDESSLKQKISSIKNDKSYSWTEDGDGNHHQTITGTNRINNDEIQIILAYIKTGEHYNLSLSYRIQSSGNLSISKINSFDIPSQFEKGNRYFTVIGSIKKDEKLKKVSANILNSLSATYVEGLQEKNFISASGLTSKWDNQIRSENGKAFNVQIGLRKSQTGTINTTIGTPIITTEHEC